MHNLFVYRTICYMIGTRAWGRLSMVSKRQKAPYWAAPVVLLALLVLSMTIGSLWHHHAGSSEAACPICHLSHQSVEPPQTGDRTPALAVVEFYTEPHSVPFVAAQVDERVPARAPPIA